MLVDPSEHLLVRRLCDTLSRGSADTLPVFPVDMEMMTRVRERVNITRKLDKLLLDNRSVSVELKLVGYLKVEFWGLGRLKNWAFMISFETPTHKFFLFFFKIMK